MSLEELRKKQEELRRQQEEAKRKKMERRRLEKDSSAKFPVKKAPNLSQIEATIGSMNVIFDQDLLNNVLSKIWFLD